MKEPSTCILVIVAIILIIALFIAVSLLETLVMLVG